MSSRVRRIFLMLGVAGLTASLMSAEEPCLGRFFGAHLLGSLQDLSLTVDELTLLNGREDPKLKRHLEWRLVSAAADARRYVDGEPVLEKPSQFPNLAHGVEKARDYVVSHHLDLNPPVPSADKSLLNPSANLEVVGRWLSRQQQ